MRRALRAVNRITACNVVLGDRAIVCDVVSLPVAAAGTFGVPSTIHKRGKIR